MSTSATYGYDSLILAQQLGRVWASNASRAVESFKNFNMSSSTLSDRHRTSTLNENCAWNPCFHVPFLHPEAPRLGVQTCWSVLWFCLLVRNQSPWWTDCDLLGEFRWKTMLFKHASFKNHLCLRGFQRRFFGLLHANTIKEFGALIFVRHHVPCESQRTSVWKSKSSLLFRTGGRRAWYWGCWTWWSLLVRH